MRLRARPDAQMAAAAALMPAAPNGSAMAARSAPLEWAPSQLGNEALAVAQLVCEGLPSGVPDTLDA